MNGLLIVVLVILAYHILDGLRRGFIKKSLSMIAIVVTLVLVTWVTPYISTFLMEETSLYQTIQGKCVEAFQNDDYDENVKTDQVMAIEGMVLPDNMKELLIENNNNEAYDLFQVSGFYEYIGAYLARLIINAIAFVCTFIMVSTLIRIVLTVLDVAALLPGLHGINKLAGGVLGFAEGIIIVWIVFLIAAIFCNGEVGRKMMELISESSFLTFLYNQNLVLKLVIGFVVS